jgi:hypothetical protein
VYQWRVSSGRLFPEEEEGSDNCEGGDASAAGVSTTSQSSATRETYDAPAAPVSMQRTPHHDRFLSVSDRVGVQEGYVHHDTLDCMKLARSLPISGLCSGGATTDATAVSLGPQLITSFCILRALSGVRIAAVACGPLHCVALSFAPHCDVYTWGTGVSGRLGHGREDDEPAPRLLEALLPYK